MHVLLYLLEKIVKKKFIDNSHPLGFYNLIGRIGNK